MSQKALIGVLVAVVVLFVAALVVRGGSEDPDASAQPDGFVGKLLGAFGEQGAVRLDELSGACVAPGVAVLQVQSSCALGVAPSDRRMRLLRLRAVEPVIVSARAPETEDLTVTKRLGADAEVEVAVGADGGVVLLRCGGLGACALTLPPGGTP